MAESDASEMIRAVLDVMPSLILVVDDDVRVLEYNSAASALISRSRETVLRRRGGEVFDCLYSGIAPGCGLAPRCKTCVIRDSVTEAFKGRRVVRRRARMDLVREGAKKQIYAMVTASPFKLRGDSLVLLIIEDIKDIADLQHMIVVCSECREVKDDKEAWSRMESYFKERWDLDFSHGLCPRCLDLKMEELDETLPPGGRS